MSNSVELIRVLAIGQIQTVVHMAHLIWKEHYTPIIGEEQVSYMLKRFQSVDAIRDEIESGSTQYYLIYSKGKTVGYVGIKLKISQLFLSKIYILPTERENGLGRQTIAELKEIASKHGLQTIFLTVNRNNTKSIAAYRKIGFTITGECCQDIGEGYVMDDFSMELALA